MSQEFDAISTQKKETRKTIEKEIKKDNNATSAYYKAKQEAARTQSFEEPVRAYEDEWEQDKYSKTTGIIISENAKMLLICLCIFAWFLTITILRITKVISPDMNLILSIPPFVAIIIAYMVFKRKRGWNSKN